MGKYQDTLFLLLKFLGDVNMDATVESEETTCKLAKGTAPATDQIGFQQGILKAQNNCLTHYILAFCRPESGNFLKDSLSRKLQLASIHCVLVIEDM